MIKELEEYKDTGLNIEQIQQLLTKLCWYQNFNGDFDLLMKSIGNLLDIATHYDELEEAGRLVELPCAIGTPIVKVIKHCTHVDYEECYGCNRFENGKCQTEFWERGFDYCDIDEFGKTVFFSMEEAKGKPNMTVYTV